MIYFVILVLLIILSIRYDLNGKTNYREQWYNIVLTIFILLAGLRFRLGEDTINYLYFFYYDTPLLKDICIDDLISSGQPPLWIILNSIVKTLGGKFFVVQLIQAAIVNILILKYFKKHSPYPFACATLFFIWKYQWYSMVIMKAAIALAIILFANDSFLEKKYKKGILLILLATGFHQSSIVLLAIPFLTFLRLNIVGIVMIVLSFFVGAYLQSKLGDVFEMMQFAEGVSNKLDSYAGGKYMTQEHNMNFFILSYLPLIIYPILSLLYIKYKRKESAILRLEPFLIVGLLFQMMQFHIQIMGRFVYIFIIYYILFVIHFFIGLAKDSILLNKSVAYFRSFTIVLPLLISFSYLRPIVHIDFYPYSSVIERSVDRDREIYYARFVANYYLNVDHY